MKNQNRVKAGKKSRKQGNDFEKRVRNDLELSGHVVDKWTNNVDLVNNKLKKVSPMWINGRMLMNSGGFPDFVCWMNGVFETQVIGVESKMIGNLDKEEIEKCSWLLKNHIFHKILIAEKTKVKNKIVIVYHDFEIKYGFT